MLNNKRILIGVCFLLLMNCLPAQNKTVYLWRNVQGMKKQPSVMFAYEPKENKSDAAVIICPGGSYHHLGLYGEGYCSAKWFAQNGITAFVLRYRTSESLYQYPAMLEDVQRAIQLLRENADEYGINPNKIGVIGYSAGGHMAAMAGAFGEKENSLEKLGIDVKVSLRPDFVMPIYPVVSMKDDIAHEWSRWSLLRTDYSEEIQEKLSIELQIPDSMPPAFILVCKDDPIVDYNNSLRLWDAIQNKEIQNCELHVYEKGKHGFGMINGPFMKEYKWNETLKEWLIKIGII